MNKYWLTPPELLDQLEREFHFDHDPCPYPRGDLNSLVEPWGRCNYVNPPFCRKYAPFGGPSAFARKAIAEQANGFSISEASQYLGMCEQKLREKAYLGEVPARKEGRYRVFLLEDLDRYLNKLPEWDCGEFNGLRAVGT